MRVAVCGLCFAEPVEHHGGVDVDVLDWVEGFADINLWRYFATVGPADGREAHGSGEDGKVGWVHGETLRGKVSILRIDTPFR